MNKTLMDKTTAHILAAAMAHINDDEQEINKEAFRRCERKRQSPEDGQFETNFEREKRLLKLELAA